MERLELGSTPCDEHCAQVGSDDYSIRAKQECRAYKHQLERMFPEADDASCFFRIVSNPHDFGAYYEVAIMYDPSVPSAVEYAFQVEANCPTTWDDEARKELGL